MKACTLLPLTILLALVSAMVFAAEPISRPATQTTPTDLTTKPPAVRNAPIRRRENRARFAGRAGRSIRQRPEYQSAGRSREALSPHHGHQRRWRARPSIPDSPGTAAKGLRPRLEIGTRVGAGSARIRHVLAHLEESKTGRPPEPRGTSPESRRKYTLNLTQISGLLSALNDVYYSANAVLSIKLSHMA